MNFQIFKEGLRYRWVWESKNETAQLLSPLHEVEKKPGMDPHSDCWWMEKRLFPHKNPTLGVLQLIVVASNTEISNQILISERDLNSFNELKWY